MVTVECFCKAVPVIFRLSSSRVKLCLKPRLKFREHIQDTNYLALHFKRRNWNTNRHHLRLPD